MTTSTSVVSVDPTTGQEAGKVTTVTSPEEVRRTAETAAYAYDRLVELPRSTRAELLRAISVELESRREDLVQIAMRETGLPAPRLEGELTRTTFQARFFADVVEEGSFLEATIDHAGDTPMGYGPDLRRMLLPVGPVAVFGASNFPFAFSVPGGDTVSAVAAGCPVVVKAHDAHPGLSLATFAALRAAAETVGAPEGTFGIVFGLEAGASLVADPAVRAVGFTGSLSGGQALLDIVNARPEPIPFYGELSSLNPVVITDGAAGEQGAALGAAMITSATGSGGQLCTKPGLVLVPRGDRGDAVVAGAVEQISQTPACTMLTAGIRDTYESLVDRGGLRSVAQGDAPEGTGFGVRAELYEIDAAQASREFLHELFGPTTLIVRYDETELPDLLRMLPSSLTGTVWSATEEIDYAARIDRALTRKVGRVLHQGWPTGVIVGWAQHHGGPWPSTNTLHTSVGATAVRRFQRPMAWQNAPAEVLPPELRDKPAPEIPRRVDGRLVLPTPPA